MYSYAWLFPFFKSTCFRALLICGSSIKREKTAFAAGYLSDTSLMRSSIIIRLRTEFSVEVLSVGSQPLRLVSLNMTSKGQVGDDNETYDMLLHLKWTTDYDDIYEELKVQSKDHLIHQPPVKK